MSSPDGNNPPISPLGISLLVRPDDSRTLHAFGETVVVLLDGKQTGEKFTAFLSISPPGGGPGPHYHEREDEWFYIVEGRVSFLINGTWTDMFPGDCVYSPRGSVHAFKNNTDQPIRVFINITKTGDLAQKTSLKIKGMYKSITGALATYGVASRAVNLFERGLVKSVEAASEAQQVHDDRALAIERNVMAYDHQQKTSAQQSKITEANVQNLIKLGEQMEKTGHDAEVLEAGWTELIAVQAMSLKMVEKQADAYSDVLSRLYGANATQQESIELGQEWSAAIKTGNLSLLKRIGATKEEIKQFRKLTSEESRRDFVAKQAAQVARRNTTCV